MRSIPKLLFLLIPLVLLVGCGDDDPAAPTVNSNTAWFEDVSAAPGEEVTMNIMIHNAEPIIFVQMPFILEETACHVTGFAFAGPFESPLLFREDEDGENCRYNTWAVVDTPIPAGDHHYATITFTIEAEAVNQDVLVEDYEYIGPFSMDPGNSLYRHFPNFGTMAAKVINVSVTAGTVTVAQPPK